METGLGVFLLHPSLPPSLSLHPSLSPSLRPVWVPSTTPEQLDLSEGDSYLAWRRNLARLEEDEGLIFTPFEKNLQFWRQLWRVIERRYICIYIQLESC